MSVNAWQSISKEDKQAIIQAYRSSNDRLFQLTCQSLKIDVKIAKEQIESAIDEQIEENYNSLTFKTRQQMKYIHIEYTGQQFDETSLINKLKQLCNIVNSDNIHLIKKLISNDERGLYPNSIAYSNRESTKKPKKTMRNELLALYPSRLAEKNAKIRIRILYQIQEEIDRKIENYLPLINNEVQFRIEMNAWLSNFDKRFSKCLIKARKVSSIEQLVSHISNKNKGRDTSWRCDDMLTCEILLKQFQKDCELQISKIHHRAVDLNIATINNEMLRIKQRTFAFGKITPTASFMEYNSMTAKVKTNYNKVLSLINKLSNVDVSEYIGNVSIKERSQKTKKRRGKTAKRKAESDKRKRLKNKTEEMKLNEQTDDKNDENNDFMDLSNIEENVIPNIEENVIPNICYKEAILLSCGYTRNNFEMQQITSDIIDCCASYLFGCIGFDLEAFMFSRMEIQIGTWSNVNYGFQILCSYLTNMDTIHLEMVNKLCYETMKATKPVIDKFGSVISTPYIDLVDNKGILVIDQNGFIVCGGFKAWNIHQLGLENIYIGLIQKRPNIELKLKRN
eukprot:188619_1